MIATRSRQASIALVAAGAMLVGMAVSGTAAASQAFPFAVEKFENTITNQSGEAATQAGSHPNALTTTIEFATHEPEPGSIEEENGVVPDPNGIAKEVVVNLPAGVLVNPNSVRVKCTEAELDVNFECPTASAVGVVDIKGDIFAGETRTPQRTAVYALAPPSNVPAELGFAVAGVVVHIVGGTRTGGDYGLSAKTSGILDRGVIYAVAVTLWGDPSSPVHSEERGKCAATGHERKEEERGIWREKLETDPSSPEAEEGFYSFNCPAPEINIPFLTLPSSCTGQPLVASMSANSWEEPEFLPPVTATSPAIAGCEKLRFEPALSVRPVEPQVATPESPTGLEVDLKVPREESLKGLAEADLKEAQVVLPAGATVSPSGANSLATCPLLYGAEEEKEEREERGEVVGINLESKQRANCPPESKIGSVEVVTPLLEHPLKGAVYLAQQGNLGGNGSNPFGSLFALYVVAEGSGTVIKLPGEIKLDRATGQVSAKFGEDPITSDSTRTRQFLPQLPFRELKMRFFGGPTAPLMTPTACGTYTTTSLLKPYGSEAEPLLEPESPAATPSSNFAVAVGCGSHLFSPTLAAGTTNPQAGGFSDETVTIARADGEQRLGGVTITTPPGLLGMLSKVPLCGERQANEGTCGAESEIGETTVAVGPGEDPYWVRGGHVYLTGPYDHEPFGLSIVVPTTAGPFTLKGEHGGFGKEVVRASIAVNPKTGAITIASDALPQILEGVPLDVRTISVDIDREGFAFNPTNCEELHVTSSMTSTEGATATPSSRFEAANCAALPFKPSFTATTQGRSSDRGNGASLNVKVTQKQGEAAIRSVHLELPKKLPARLSTLQKACPEATFYTNPANCPASADVGKAIAHTPVLPVPLEGPAYFVSHGSAEYPELVFVLQGDGVTIQLAGETHINSKTKITTSTFGTVPDAPITSFEANLPEAPNSALNALTPKGLCIYKTKALSMPTIITGQNGAQIKQTTKVAITGCPKKHKQKRHKQRKARPTGKKAGARR